MKTGLLKLSSFSRAKFSFLLHFFQRSVESYDYKKIRFEIMLPPLLEWSIMYNCYIGYSYCVFCKEWFSFNSCIFYCVSLVRISSSLVRDGTVLKLVVLEADISRFFWDNTHSPENMSQSINSRQSKNSSQSINRYWNCEWANHILYFCTMFSSYIR
jgi:hypothetical protein